MKNFRTIEVTVPYGEFFEASCHVCDLHTNDFMLIDYSNKEEPICLNCKQEKVDSFP